MKPKEISRNDRALVIRWSDETSQEIPFRAIRLHCGCAVCKEATTPIDPSMPFFERAISFRNLDLVGNYAVQILWGDGHRSIMPFDKLSGIAVTKTAAACGCGKQKSCHEN